MNPDMDSLETKNILIIEDELYPREQIKNILLENLDDAQSIEFIITDVVEYALQKMNEKNPVLITVDGGLGGGDRGADFIQACTNEYPEIMDRIVIYSGDDRFIGDFASYHNVKAFDKNKCIPERLKSRDKKYYMEFRECLRNKLID